MLNRSFELCLKTYGEKHMLMLRLYLNIGILYEDNRDFQKAYDYFVKWHETCQEVSGARRGFIRLSSQILEGWPFCFFAKGMLRFSISHTEYMYNDEMLRKKLPSYQQESNPQPSSY